MSKTDNFVIDSEIKYNILQRKVNHGNIVIPVQ